MGIAIVRDTNPQSISLDHRHPYQGSGVGDAFSNTGLPASSRRSQGLREEGRGSRGISALVTWTTVERVDI